MDQSNNNPNKQSMDQHNEGIIVKGGSFQADQVVVGRMATAIYNSAAELKASGKEEVANAIADLLKVMQEQAVRIKNLEEIVEVVQQVAEEAKKEKPNKVTLKGLLDGLKDVLTPVAEIVPKLITLQGAIALMLGLPKI